MLVRTTSGPSSYDVSLGMTAWQDKPAFVGFASARSERGRIVGVSYGIAGSLYATDPEAAGVAGHQTTLCKTTNVMQLCWGHPGPNQFPGLLAFGAWYQSGSSSRGDDNIVFIAANGAAVGMTFKGKGWKLVRVPMTYRRVDGSSASLAWANADIVGAEVFLNATAPGGRYGSIAVAMPPCSAADVGVSRGVGSVSLTGGATDVSAICPALSLVVLTSHATRSTTWNFDGTAAGDNMDERTRVFVVDLPKKLPPTAA